MKYIFCGIFIIFFLVFLFFSQDGEQESVSGLATENSTEVAVDSSEVKKALGKNQLKETSIKEISDSSFKKKVLDLTNEAIDEISECERKFDDVLTVPVDDLNKIDNQSLLFVLEEFDELSITSPKLSKLLDLLSTSSDSGIKSNDHEIMENLSLVRPCRPFEKIALINELTKRFKGKKADVYFKERIRKSIRLYLRKELSGKSNLSTINMIANVTHSLLEESIFDESLLEKSEELLESLETEFDDLVDMAEESLEDGDDFNQGLLTKESLISEKYRSQLSSLVERM